MPAAKRTQAPPRIRIRPLSPVIDAGRYAPKRCVGDVVTVAADVFSDGHEKLRAVIRYRAPGGRNWLDAEMRAIDAGPLRRARQLEQLGFLHILLQDPLESGYGSGVTFVS